MITKIVIIFTTVVVIMAVIKVIIRTIAGVPLGFFKKET